MICCNVISWQRKHSHYYNQVHTAVCNKALHKQNCWDKANQRPNLVNVKIRRYLHHALICKDKEKYKYLDHAKSRAGLRACGVDCDQAVDSAWVTHGKSGHGEDLDHDHRIILVINFIASLMMLFLLSWLFFLLNRLSSKRCTCICFPISRIIPCQNVGTCTVPEAHNPEKITLVFLL